MDSLKKTYRAWYGARSRCLNTKHKAYKYYGGRGIRMCQEWIDSFAAFLRDVGECPEGTVLDRENNDGNYEPGNVRWVTWAVSGKNKRSKFGDLCRPIPIRTDVWQCPACKRIHLPGKDGAAPVRCSNRESCGKMFRQMVEETAQKAV